MAGTTVLHQSYHDSTNASTLPSSPFPFSSFLSDSLFSLDPAVSAPPPVAPPPPPPAQHQAGLFVHSKEINPFERSFAVLDSTSISDLKPALDRKNRRENGPGGLTELHLPTPKARRKRALSSPALFTPGGTGQRIDDGTAQAFRQAKRPSLRLAVEETGGGGLPAIPGLARGLIDSSASVTLSDSTGSSRSNTSHSFEDDLNFIPKGSRGRISTASPASSTGFSPPATKPTELRASSTDSFSNSNMPPPAPTTFAHFQPQPQPIPFHIPTIAPHPAAAFPGSSQPFTSSNFASTTLAPASMPRPAVAPLVNDPSFHESTMSYTSMEDSAYGFSDPFALVPHHAQSSIYPNLASAVPPTHPSIPPPHSAYQRAAVIPQAPTFSVPTHFGQLNPSSQPFVPLQASTSSSQQQPQYTTQTSSKSIDFGTKPTGKKRGRKPKNWDPTLEMEIELDPEEQEKQRKLALERNRIAASKSRRRKKEKVEALEGAARGYCEGNQTLQSQCQALLAEVHQLRAYLIQAHPQPGCQCHHVHGYFARERDGGGLPAIMFEAQGTLDRDFSKAPKWGNDDDVYAGFDCDQHRRQNKNSNASTSNQLQVSQSRGGGPKIKPKSPVKKGGKKQQEAESEDDDEDDGEGDSEEESEEEKVSLKSRRARAIPLRKT